MQIHRFLDKISVTVHYKPLCVYVFTMLFISSALYAKTNVLFSPRGQIKDTIIEKINSSEKSIDIAVLIFTAGEIAEALYEAKGRGVQIRVVIDHNQKKKRYPVIEFLKEEGFDLKFLKGNIGGVMNNTFAIFDANSLVTGSYNWTEYAEKFNYENAIFTDEPDVVEKFQEEFGSLYDKGVEERVVKQEGPEAYVSISKVEATELKNKEALSVSKNNVHKKEVEKVNATKLNDTASAIESSSDFVNVSFSEFNGLFGEGSNLTKAEKKQIWKDKFKGKYVRWIGKVKNKGIAIYDWNKVVIDHQDSDIDAQLKFDWTKRKEVMSLSLGDLITYTGRLISLQGYSSSYKLDYADVIKAKIIIQ